MHLYAYKSNSEGAKALANALKIKRVNHDKKEALRTDVLINWGAGHIKREYQADAVFNQPEAVQKAVNKLRTFRTLKGLVPMPDFTESHQEASRWLAEGHTVIERETVTGHSGKGIVVHEPDDLFIKDNGSPLYTKYIEQEQEYRVHVFLGNAFFFQRKARKKAVPDDKVNWKIRNHDNGFIFAHKEVVVPRAGFDIAVLAVHHLGLDFGAVDLMQGKDGKWYVIEVNTACGMEGTTLQKYAEQFEQYYADFFGEGD